jgi:cell division protein FtsB
MRTTRPGAVSLGLSIVILYLALNAVTGRQGLISYVKLQSRERDLIAERDDLADQASALRAKIHALAETSLDKDALEEVARRELGAARRDEMIFNLAQNEIRPSR